MLYHKVNEYLKIKSEKQNKRTNPQLRKITGPQKLIKELPVASVRNLRNDKDVRHRPESICCREVTQFINGGEMRLLWTRFPKSTWTFSFRDVLGCCSAHF